MATWPNEFEKYDSRLFLLSFFKWDLSNLKFSSFLTLFPNLTKGNYYQFKNHFDDKEIKNIVFSIKAFKVLRVDGLHAIFFQSLWEVIGKSICDLIKNTYD